MPESATGQNEQSLRLGVKLRRELGDTILDLLDDDAVEDIVLNPDSTLWVKQMTFTSPFSAAFSLPLDLQVQETKPIVANWPIWISFVAFYAALDIVLALSVIWLFRMRWRVSH